MPRYKLCNTPGFDVTMSDTGDDKESYFDDAVPVLPLAIADGANLRDLNEEEVVAKHTETTSTVLKLFHFLIILHDYVVKRSDQLLRVGVTFTPDELDVMDTDNVPFGDGWSMVLKHHTINSAKDEQFLDGMKPDDPASKVAGADFIRSVRDMSKFMGKWMEILDEYLETLFERKPPNEAYHETIKGFRKSVEKLKKKAWKAHDVLDKVGQGSSNGN